MFVGFICPTTKVALSTNLIAAFIIMFAETYYTRSGGLTDLERIFFHQGKASVTLYLLWEVELIE